MLEPSASDLRADNRRDAVRALSAGDVRSDAIRKAPAATACGQEATLAYMSIILLNVRNA